eukprot:TRINITY_DN11745_c0_g1_i1.p1 TRINITY_DN11745_c0_g1~~TRINITY_DN11745_c0_g1_i1.p1  ORF type:complete len:347 (-),score=16.33 TRINITY_DN11745_c0_g1_i1:95-1135(-)
MFSSISDSFRSLRHRLVDLGNDPEDLRTNVDHKTFRKPLPKPSAAAEATVGYTSSSNTFSSRWKLALSEGTFMFILFHSLLWLTTIRRGYTPQLRQTFVTHGTLAAIPATLTVAFMKSWLQAYDLLRNPPFLTLFMVIPGVAGWCGGAVLIQSYAIFSGVRIGRFWRFNYGCACAFNYCIWSWWCEYQRALTTYNFLAYHASINTPEDLITPALRREYRRHLDGCGLRPGGEWLQYYMSSQRRAPWSSDQSVDLGLPDDDLRRWIKLNQTVAATRVDATSPIPRDVVVGDYRRMREAIKEATGNRDEEEELQLMEKYSLAKRRPDFEPTNTHSRGSGLTVAAAQIR